LTVKRTRTFEFKARTFILDCPDVWLVLEAVVYPGLYIKSGFSRLPGLAMVALLDKKLPFQAVYPRLYPRHRTSLTVLEVWLEQTAWVMHGIVVG
jgi:hypothetical protein